MGTSDTKRRGERKEFGHVTEPWADIQSLWRELESNTKLLVDERMI